MSGDSGTACIDADVAVGYATRQLLPDERHRVEEHIDECAGCRVLVSTAAKAAWSRGSSGASGEAPPPVGGVLPRGTRVGPFEVDVPLSAGGMGLVYTAHDVRLGRRVALKGVRDLRGDPAELLREAQAMARLSHPNVVPVYDVIEAHGQVFIAMELVVGGSLRQWLDAEPRGWKAVVDAFLDAGAGLAAAHDAGVVHGDVKPANLLVGDDGRVRVTDFGLSAFGPDAEAGGSGPRGTPAYMAPAQRGGAPCDALGDQYSFSASLHEALFGSLPGSPPARALRVPGGLRRVVARGSAADARARYPSMAALLRALRSVRRARARWAAAGAASAAAFLAAAYASGGRRAEARLCEDSAPRLSAPWHDEARFAVRRSFENSGLPYAPQIFERVEANLDRWARAFDGARASACGAGWLGGGPEPGRLSARLECLEERAQEARTLVGVLRDAPDANTVLNAVSATEGLAPPSRCDAPPAREAPTVGRGRRQLSDRFARAHALTLAGKYSDALPLNRALVLDADASGEPSTRSAALVSLGATQVKLGEYDAAGATLQQALQLAEAAQDDLVRAQAWVNLVSNEYGRGRHDRVVFVKAPALGAAERVGDVFLQSELMLLVGGSLSQLGKAAEAQPMFERAVQLRRRHYGDKDGRVASALSALGNAYAMRGDLDAGIPAHREAVEAGEAAMGASHPAVGVMRENLGCDFLYALRLPEAIAELDAAAKIAERASGGRRELAASLTDLGLSLLEAGQHDRAAATLERADALWAAAGPEHPQRAQALVGNYLAREALGRTTSRADLETALALSQQAPPFERARVQFALARASAEGRGGEGRAVELAKAAASGFASLPLPLNRLGLDRAKAWLRDRGVDP